MGNVNSYFKIILISLLVVLLIMCCSKSNEENSLNKKNQSSSNTNSIKELLSSPKWNFEKKAYENIGAQILFQDSISTLALYKNLVLQDGFANSLINMYDTLPDCCYLPGFVSYIDYLESMHFRLELLLGQKEILNLIKDDKTKLLKIVCRKHDYKFELNVNPFYTKASGAYLASRILNSFNYQSYLDSLKINTKFQVILDFREPINKIITSHDDFAIYNSINQLGLNYLQNER